ncbi:MAG TPA: bifunctional UDP-N-acetylglucosamine diphosphorylase/glucosamine-1-phosphate N-acetyltransferase GlmU [Solirubrobacteraceae bacterium]|nr:bifunctional UDP-N-acetylglucosamine diphosphorylase/glucosamine-1-phosphate N-acetyltransferase GlmU [Solirubrobacteraceae bacterium]
MSGLSVVILAAGEGTRMRSSVPKVLHPLCGRPLIAWPVLAARAAGAERIVVVDGPRRALADHLPDDVAVAIQEEARGTGDAVRAAADHLHPEVPVVVLAGDVPLITGDAIQALVTAHNRARAAATMATMILDDPGGYGRVVRDADGGVVRVVETKKPGDATPEEMALREVNTGIFCFDAGLLRTALDHVKPDNAQGEYYLPDVLPALREAGHAIAAHVVDDPVLTLGVNDRADLATVRAHAQRRIHAEHMRRGVTLVDPAQTTIDADVIIGQDTVIEPGTHLRGRTSIGEECTIGPASTLVDAVVANRVTIRHAYVDSAVLADGATVGPFAYLRPGTALQEDAKVGTFVEVKNSNLGRGVKVPHLSYLGDADVGERTNIGAGTITANYDYTNKNRTTIGRDARVSVDTSLVAPVTIGDGAYTAAGSVITEDVPPGALGVARQRQRNVEGYADRKTPKER